MPMQQWIRPTLIVNALFFITLASNAWAKAEAKPTLKTSYQAFVPKNWKVLEKAQGDLNQDGQADITLIIEDTNPEHIVKNDRLGSDLLNINERKLLVLLKQTQGYQLAATNTTLPTEGDLESLLSHKYHKKNLS